MFDESEDTDDPKFRIDPSEFKMEETKNVKFDKVKTETLKDETHLWK